MNATRLRLLPEANAVCASIETDLFMDFSLFCVNRAKNSGFRTRGNAGCPVLFHPDYTVGPGIQPGLLTSVIAAMSKQSARGLRLQKTITAGGELHPAPRTCS